MSQHGCPERLSNRSKGFQEDGPSQPTMEVLVETLTGTAFEMTVSPSDTIFTIKSKIFRVEGIPVSQQHLLYNLKELEDSSSLREHAIADGARLRLVLGMRGGPISTRRLPPPAPPNSEPWPDIERLLDSNRDDMEWTSNGCKVTVLVFRDGERVNMLRVRENHDGTYSPLDTKYSAREASRAAEGGGAGALRDNAVTMGKMLELRNRMEALTLQRTGERVEIQKTRSEETLTDSLRAEAPRGGFATCLDNSYSRFGYECGARYTLLPAADDAAPALPWRQRSRSGEEGAILEECLGDECLRAEPPHERGPLVEGCAWRGGHSASALQLRAGAGGGAGGAGGGGGGRAAPAPLDAALFSSSTSELENLKRNSRILPALSRARPRSHLHLSDEGLHLARPEPPAPPAPPRRAPPHPPQQPAAHVENKDKKIKVRCGMCRKRLSVAAVHVCRCGALFCAPHRYAEVHGCAYDYKAPARPRAPLRPPKLPKI